MKRLSCELNSLVKLGEEIMPGKNLIQDLYFFFILSILLSCPSCKLAINPRSLANLQDGQDRRMGRIAGKTMETM